MNTPETYNIRPAIRSDATTLAHIELQAQFARGVQLTDEQYHSEALRISKLLQSETTWSGVAQSSSDEFQPVGFIFGYPRIKEGRLSNDHHLDTLMVLPSHWRRGIADHLIDLALLDAARQDASSVNLWTDIDNESARPLYGGKGFILTGETRTHPWLPKEQVEYSIPIGSHESLKEVGELPEAIPVAPNFELRKLTPDDALKLFDILQTNPDIARYVAWPAKVKAMEDIVPRIQEYSNENMDGRFGMILNGELIGYVGIYKDGDQYAPSYFLDAAHRGHQYATRATRALIKAAYTELGARKFYLQVQPDNKASTNVAEMLSFKAAETVMGVDFPVEQQRWRLDTNALKSLVA